MILAQQSVELLIRQRSVVLVVADLDAAAEAARAAVEAVGGSVESRNGGRLSIAVPEARAAELERRVLALGDLVSDTARSEDAAFREADLESALRAARGRRAELTQLQARARSVPEGLLVERRIAEVDAALATTERELRSLRQRAARVLLALELRQKPIERLPVVRLPVPWLDTLSGSELQNPSHAPAPADDGGDSKLTSNLDMSANLEGRWLDDRPAPGEDSRALLLAVHFRGARTDPVGIAGGYDVRLGGLDGFVYEFRGFAGVGMALGSFFTLSLLGGVGVSSWTGGRVPSSLELPVGLFALLDFGALGRLSLFAQPRWTVTREARRDGARHGIGDELTLGAALLLPFVFGQDDVDDGGLRLGFEYGELLGTKMFAVSAGIGFGFPGH